jgi:3-phosphoshikimate 1-carboxyvinyltransferase
MPTLPALLPIAPFTRPALGAVSLPGSKSLTNRALLLAALCDQPVLLTGALYSEDTALMAEALRQLGFSVEASPAAGGVRVSHQARGLAGCGGSEAVEIHVGLAGTAARFLTALCAALPRGVYRIDGVPQMRKRPMRPLLDALRALGAEVRCSRRRGIFSRGNPGPGSAGRCRESRRQREQPAAIRLADGRAPGPIARGDARWRARCAGRLSQ